MRSLAPLPSHEHAAILELVRANISGRAFNISYNLAQKWLHEKLLQMFNQPVLNSARNEPAIPQTRSRTVKFAKRAISQAAA